MSKLTQGDSLKIQLGAPEENTLVMHPEEGRKIEIWTQQEELNLFVDQDAFIENDDPYEQVTLSQENDFDKGALQMKNPLKKALGNPDRVQIFRKMNNVFLKPV